MAMVRAGVPVLVLPMPLSGTTAPMTVLGTVDRQRRRAAQRGRALPARPARLRDHLRDGRRRGRHAQRPLSLRHAGVRAHERHRHRDEPLLRAARAPGSAITCDAKASNQQAGAEGMLTGAACALAGADTILAFGCSDGAQSLSLAKVVLDCDSVGALRRLVRDDPIDATRALVDDIAAVGIGGHYLGRKSTRAVPPRRRGLAAGAVAARAVRAVRGAAARRGGRRPRRRAPAHARGGAAAPTTWPRRSTRSSSATRAAWARRTARVRWREARPHERTRRWIVVGPLDGPRAPMRRLGRGLRARGRRPRRRDGIVAAWGAPRRRAARRRHRPRAATAAWTRVNWMAVDDRLPAPRHRRGAATPRSSARRGRAACAGSGSPRGRRRSSSPRGSSRAPPGPERDAPARRLSSSARSTGASASRRP